MKKAEDILNENLFGVHKEMITKHWAFKKCVLEAMEKYAEYKQLTIPAVVGRSEQLPCDECVDGQKWSPYYAKYVECDCRK